MAFESNLPSVIERLDRMAAAAVVETRALLERSAVVMRGVAVAAIKETTPKRTGGLAGSTTGEITLAADSAGITIRQTKTVPWRGSDYPLARFLIDGTDAHDIYPVTAKALYWEGADHPVAHVHHPGFPGRDYPREAMDTALPAIDAALALEAGVMAHAVVRSLAI